MHENNIENFDVPSSVFPNPEAITISPANVAASSDGEGRYALQMFAEK